MTGNPRKNPRNLAMINIKALYKTLEWYSRNPGAGKAAVVLQYYDLWKDLHTLSVNISREGWDALRRLAQQDLGVILRSKEQQWLFLFAVETYLDILIRSMALSKLGRTPSDIEDLKEKINSNNYRNIFSPSVYEWIFLAAEDDALNTNVKQELGNAITMLLRTLSAINVATLSFDSFRVLYQNILPREIRRSLGEFYTNENIVNEVLDAAGFDCKNIKIMYDKWEAGHKIKILDPACGSGSFLVGLIKRIFNCLNCKSKIVEFIESILYGVDINAFAAEMAKLNVILAISDGLQATCGPSVYVVQKVNVFWGDSLAVALEAKLPNGTRVLRLRIPSLARFLESPEKEILLPPPDVIDPVTVISGAAEYLKEKKSREDFVREYLNKIPINMRANYVVVLNDTWDIISSIIKAGNSRAIELLKSSLRILRHMGLVDYVVGNPPWVRIHEISKAVRERLRSDFKFYGQGSSYDPGFKKTRTPFRSQQDYSMAFVERGLSLLKPGGVLSYVITSKILKTTYAGRLRQTLLQDTTILRLIDYSLYPVPLFVDVVNYPLIIAIKKNKPPEGHKVNVTVYNTVGDHKDFQIEQTELSLNRDDCKSPWILAPKQVIDVFRKLQRKGDRLGDVYEIMRGVMTSANELFIIKEVLDCKNGIVRVKLENDDTVDIEEWLIHPMIRGEDIDPFTYKINNYIIFTHDPQTLEPLWDSLQKKILELLGLLSRGWNVDASGQVLVYESSGKDACERLLQRMKYLRSSGYTVKNLKPCRVSECIEIWKDKSSLKINVESSKSICKVYVEGLKIPNAPYATQHFMKNLDKLIRRDDYKINLPPWSIFRVSEQKFQKYRIAWQENTKHFEATHLPVQAYDSLCTERSKKFIVPIQTVYFISEKDKCNSLAVLIYLNSRLIRSIMKLIAWSARGGHFRHISYTVGHLPLPPLQDLRKICSMVTIQNNDELNVLAKSITEKSEHIIAELLGLDKKEYEEVVSFGEWLNKLTNDSNDSSGNTATNHEMHDGLDEDII